MAAEVDAESSCLLRSAVSGTFLIKNGEKNTCEHQTKDGCNVFIGYGQRFEVLTAELLMLAFQSSVMKMELVCFFETLVPTILHPRIVTLTFLGLLGGEGWGYGTGGKKKKILRVIMPKTEIFTGATFIFNVLNFLTLSIFRLLVDLARSRLCLQVWCITSTSEMTSDEETRTKHLFCRGDSNQSSKGSASLCHRYLKLLGNWHRQFTYKKN